MKCTQTSYMDFVFMSGILSYLCALPETIMHALFFWLLMTIIPEYNGREEDAKIYNESWLSC